MNALVFARFLVVLTVIGLLTACGGDGGTAPASGDTTPVTAVIGSAGGTLTGPDGVQVVVPAGAVDQPTTIGIARSSAGAPAELPEGSPPTGGIYEFTPHGLVFNAPVVIRMPVPPNVAGTEVFMADLGEDWQVNGATVVGGFAEWERNSFSFGMLYACIVPANNTDPYWCSRPYGFASASATPNTAITRRTSGYPGGNAGTWVVNSPGTVELTLHYFAAPDCGSPTVKLLRWNPAAPANTPGRVQTLLNNIPVTLTQTQATAPGAGFASTGGAPTLRGVGSTAFDVSAYLTDAINAFGFTFSCQRPGKTRQSGGDLITFIGSMPAPVGPFTIGGTVNGLTGAGLVLRNNGGDDLPVAASGPFAFATAIAAGTGYSVSVATQPAGQNCTVQNGTGANVQGNVATVAVTCGAVGPAPLAATAIAAGFWNSLAVATDGTVWAWGHKVDPITGGYKNASPWATQPVQVQGLTGVKAVALSSVSGAFYALHIDGTVSAWGLNNVGQLGDRTTTTRSLPVKVMQDATTPMDEVCSIAASSSILLMARATGCSPGNRPIASGPWIAGLFNSQSIGGDPPGGSIAKAVPGLPAGVAVSRMGAHEAADATVGTGGAVFFALANGSSYAWGYNNSNRLGAGISTTFAGGVGGPVEVSFFWSGTCCTEIGSTFAIAVDETTALVAVGTDANGELGNGGAGNSTLQLTPVSVLSNVTAFSTGQVGAAAITNGELWAWGTIQSGAVQQPTRLGTGTGFTQVSVGDRHGLAIGPGGEVYSWGDGTNGGLGNGATSGSSSIPAVVMRP